jgi:hypothetical protein
LHVSHVDEDAARRELAASPSLLYSHVGELSSCPAEVRPRYISYSKAEQLEIRRAIEDSLAAASFRFPSNRIPPSHLVEEKNFPAAWSELKPEPSEKRLHVLME